MVQSDTESRLNALVEKLLPASLVDVLLLAESVGALAPTLEVQGHRVARLRWRDQADYVQHPDRTARGLVQVNLARPETAGRQFDLAVIADLTSDVHPLVLFEQLDLALKADGIVVLVAREDLTDQLRLAHWRDYLVAIGKRFGFVLIEPESASLMKVTDGWMRILRKSAPPRWRISHVVGMRDWAYLAHRYLCHPHHHYEVLLVSTRFTGRPLGIAVLRRHEASCELLDVIGPLRNLDPVVDQARRMTGRWGLPYLYCWITRNHLPLFFACDGREEALDICIPTSCWTSDARAEKMKGAWWLMAGDTDFH